MASFLEKIALKDRWPIWLLVAAAIVLVGWYGGSYPGAVLQEIDVTKVGTTFAGLLFIALIIERVIEVYIQPRSEAKKLEITSEVTKAKAEMAALAPQSEAAVPLKGKAAAEYDAAKEKVAQAEADVAPALQEQRLETMKVATPLAILIGLLVAVSGVRAMGGFVVNPPDAELYGSQWALFNIVDVLFTAGLLAGGADGIHKILDSFITRMDKLKPQS